MFCTNISKGNLFPASTSIGCKAPVAEVDNNPACNSLGGGIIVFVVDFEIIYINIYHSQLELNNIIIHFSRFFKKAITNVDNLYIKATNKEICLLFSSKIFIFLYVTNIRPLISKMM